MTPNISITLNTPHVTIERYSELTGLDGYGIETYRDWALTTRGGAQFDLLAGTNDSAVCSSVYAGVCE